MSIFAGELAKGASFKLLSTQAFCLNSPQLSQKLGCRPSGKQPLNVRKIRGDHNFLKCSCVTPYQCPNLARKCRRVLLELLFFNVADECPFFLKYTFFTNGWSTRGIYQSPVALGNRLRGILHRHCEYSIQCLEGSFYKRVFYMFPGSGISVAEEQSCGITVANNFGITTVIT